MCDCYTYFIICCCLCTLRISNLAIFDYCSSVNNLTKRKKNIHICTVGQKKIKNKNKNPEIFINFNTNSRREIKLVPINMDYCLLQFDAIKYFLGVHLHGGSQPNFNFFNVNPQIF